MTAAPNATRMTTRSIAREHELIAREAEDLAHMAIGSAQQIAEAARRLELRALKAQIVGETAELFTADLEAKETT
jgi:hypothetical protein